MPFQTHDFQAILQSQAPTIIKRKQGEAFPFYWKKIVLAAGVNLVAKLDRPGLPQEESLLNEAANDLTTRELEQVAKYLLILLDTLHIRCLERLKQESETLP